MWWHTVTHGRGTEGETSEWSGWPYYFTLPRNMVYPALLPLMRTPRLPVVDWTDAPADFNGLVRFAERRILVSARVSSHINWPPFGWRGIAARLDKERRSWACDVDVVWKALSDTNTSMGPTEHGRSKQSSKQVYWYILKNRIYGRQKYPLYCEINGPLVRTQLTVNYIRRLTGTVSSTVDRRTSFCVSEYVTFVDSDLCYKHGKRKKR
jgi:hypothetical protein